MLGDEYIDKQNFIYRVKRGQRYPCMFVWDEVKHRYHYYRKDKYGKLKLIPFKYVHASWLMWDPSDNTCFEHVRFYRSGNQY